LCCPSATVQFNSVVLSFCYISI